MPDEFVKRVQVIGPMPPYFKVAEALWGVGVDFDSDGDSSFPEDTCWRELTVILRPDYDERIDIDPDDDDRNSIIVKSDSQALLARTLHFLVSCGAVRLLDEQTESSDG